MSFCPKTLTYQNINSYTIGWQGTVRLHLWYRRCWLLGHVRSAEYDERQWRLPESDHQHSRILLVAHGYPVFCRHYAVATVSVGFLYQLIHV